ncbi:hypothetical protein M0805_005571 [Coniferiporia weirii]|nr:hypothetical protein M0805_005571 [Coniferiporia weirii]
MDRDSGEEPVVGEGPSMSVSHKTRIRIPFGLNPLEIWWRDRSGFLESKGYRLRPRFRPEWKPSWVDTAKNPLDCEDSFNHKIRRVMDARRIEGGSLVAIKKVSPYSKEAEIALMLSTPEALKDPMNHCVPILDHMRDESDENQEYIVMPLLRRFNQPEFYAISEVLDFIRQTLEGLVYMHRRRVAHCDLAHLNIMMDGSSLYPHGFHPDPSWQLMLPDFSDLAEHRLRIDTEGIKYFIIDYDISAYYENPDEPPLAYGDDGMDRELPELKWGKPYDPFPGDVFTLGNVYKKFFTTQYSNLEFLAPLVQAMTQLAPTDRPTAEEALNRFSEITSTMSGVSARWRLRPIGEKAVRCVALELYSVMREIMHVMKSLFPNPQRVISTAVPFTIAALVALHGPRRVMDRIRTVFIHSRDGH